jgi:class 3 adenylate cyclase/CHASE2 domain-containing sensor protein
VLLRAFCLSVRVRLSFLKSPVVLCAASVILVVCCLELAHIVAFQRMEWMTYDWRVRLAHGQGGSAVRNASNLGLIEVNDATIAAVNSGELGFSYGLYWPREVYSRGLHELERDGAKCVAFDVLFAELRLDHPPVPLRDGTEVSSDEYFARQLKESGNVILAADQDVMPHRLFATNCSVVANISVSKDADGVLRRDRAFEDIRVWASLIQAEAKKFDFDLSRTRILPGRIIFVRQRDKAPGVEDTVEFPLDGDGNIDTSSVLKSVPPGYPGKIVPFRTYRAWSMGICMASKELGFDLDHAEIEPGRITLRGTNGITRSIPVDKDRYFYVDWRLTQNDPNVAKGNFAELLLAPIERANGNDVPNHWKDKLVLIGSTATGNDLSDMGATPLENHTLLCTKHLNVANSVISGRFVQTTPEIVTLLLIVLVGIASSAITWSVAKPAHGSLLMLAFATVYVVTTVYLFAEFRLWVPIILPMVCAGLITHLVAVTYRVVVEQSERKRVKQLFSRLVSPDVVNEVLDAPTLNVGGVRRDMTIFFADVRGFTQLTDENQAKAAEYIERFNLTREEAEAHYDAQAHETLKTVSTYLAVIADCVKQHKGTLDKYIGDCVMAFWGAPLPDSRHAANAVEAAIDAQLALYALNVERQAQNQKIAQENTALMREKKPTKAYLPILSMGSGINTGTAIAGLMGSDAHIVNYTVFGREVNLASRLEGVSGHGRIIIGEATHAALLKVDPKLAESCVELEPQLIKGFRNKVRIFEVKWDAAAGAPLPPGSTEYRENKASEPEMPPAV